MSIRVRVAALFVSLFCVFTPVKFFAQDSAEPTEAASDDTWYYGAVIKSVTFKGLKSVSSKELDGVVSSYYGKKFSDELFGDMMDRIYAMDLFEDINPQALPGDVKRSTVSIIFTVKEKPVVTKIRILGNKQIRTTEIKEALSSKEKDIYVPSKISVDERAIRDHYLEKGFTNATVRSAVKETEKGVEITYTVNEGRSTVIAHINFSGNKVISSKTLKKKLKLKEVGILNKGAFQESMLEADKQAILSYYANEGYIDVSIVDVPLSTEFNEKTRHPVIDLMPDQVGVTDKGGTMRLGAWPCRLEEGSLAKAAYGAELISERHRHRYEFNNNYRCLCEENGLRLSGKSPDDRLVEIVECAGGSWFLGVQFHPEFLSRPNRPHPLFSAFCKAQLERKKK